MVKNKSVIVIGAGASSEAGLPLGTQLKDHISNLLRFKDGRYQLSVLNETIDDAIHFLSDQDLDRDSLYEACGHIREAMPQVRSIDEFIDAHKGNKSIEQCGKLAIVLSILTAEKASNLSVKFFSGLRNWPEYKKINYNKLKSTWFNEFWQLVTENCQESELSERFSKITLIIFNYDRCVEHFLFSSLKNVYRLEDDHAAHIVNNMSIYHPYGKVGNLPWQNKQDCIAYGDSPNHHQLIKLANKIKTFTEGTDPDSSEISEIRDSMLNAETVLFLGFAFHRLNMQLISSTNSLGPGSRRCRVYATARGISDSDIEPVKADIRALFKTDNTMLRVRNDKECSGLFHEYRRSLYLF